MNPTDVLAQLKDIHLPEPVSIWPLAPGWYLIIVIITALIITTFYYGYRHWKKLKRRKYALEKLIEIETNYQSKANAGQTIADISHLLKRIALTQFPRKNIAGLHSTQWLNFLNETGDTEEFSQQPASLLATATYQPIQPQDIKPIFSLVRKWIKRNT